MFTIQLTEEQLELILDSLETQAIHCELDHEWSKASDCRELAADLTESSKGY